MGRPGIDFPGVGVGLVLLRAGKVLLCRRLKAPEASLWSIPGGKVDFMEKAEDALRRETLEETGLSVGSLRLLCVDEQIFPGENHHWFSLLYVTEDFSGKARLMEPEKHDGMEWFALDVLPDNLSAFVKTAVSHL